MKEKIYNFTFCLFCFLAIFFIFKNNIEVAKVIIQAVNLFFQKVFVSLFPMFILNDIFIYLNLPYYFYIIFGPFFKKVFKTSGTCAYTFIMSLISGTPSSAYILKNLVENKQLSIKEAEHYLTFTYFSNPLFLTLMLGLMFTSSTVIKIILIHYLSNIIIAFLLRGKAPKITSAKLEVKKAPFGTILIHSIERTMSTLLIILGTIVFYMLLCFIITSFLPQNLFLQTFIAGILEITNGLNHLILLNTSLKIKEIMACAIISFGGLSIHTQVKSILEDTEISYTPFFKGRVFQALISILLVIIF